MDAGRKNEGWGNDTLVARLVARFGAEHAAHIRRGVRQVLERWTPADGGQAELEAFIEANLLCDPAALDACFRRFAGVLEEIAGRVAEVERESRRPADLAGPLLAVDGALASLDMAAQLDEALFESKVAFVALLNFPVTALAERVAAGPVWSRREWAAARLAVRFAHRIPATVHRSAARAEVEAELYITGCDLAAHDVFGPAEEGAPHESLRLSCHWGLRDEIAALYDARDGLRRQRLIASAMESVVAGTLPTRAAQSAAPGSGSAHGAAGSGGGEGRYEHLLAQLRAARAVDACCPHAPTLVERAFDAADVQEEQFSGVLDRLLDSPLAEPVAAEVGRRLGRPLEPHDLWYPGFRRSGHPAAAIESAVRARYPTVGAFAADVPRILRDLAFPEETARFLAAHIVVEVARGAGHALPPGRRGDQARLRVPATPNGLDAKGYATAIHELGHCVEQVLSLHRVDHVALAGVPGNACTEALAFAFESRAVALLGLPGGAPQTAAEGALADFWAAREMAGAAACELAVWRWMYAHRPATAGELREGVLGVARGVWNRSFAPLLGGADRGLLAVYSHIITNPLYLLDYVLGHVIAHQLEACFREAGAFGPEVERMASFGALTPDLWTLHATGQPLRVEALLEDTGRALAVVDQGARAGAGPEPGTPRDGPAT